jgi:hypothetical protein
MSTEPILPSAQTVIQNLGSLLAVISPEIYADALERRHDMYGLPKLPRDRVLYEYEAIIQDAKDWLHISREQQKVWRSQHPAASTGEEAT